MDWQKICAEFCASRQSAHTVSSSIEAEELLSHLIGPESLRGAVDFALKAVNGPTAGTELMRMVLKILRSPIVCDYLFDIYKTRLELSIRRECASLLYDCARDFQIKYLDILLRDPDEFIASVGIKYLTDWSYSFIDGATDSDQSEEIGFYLDRVANHPHPSIPRKYHELVKLFRYKSSEKIAP
jgi:hypothetical protein